VSIVVDLERVRRAVGDVPDPELPVIGIGDLGILRAVIAGPNGTVQVVITPTYSGCPALEAIADDVLAALATVGVTGSVRVELTPPWSTDQITARGRQALADHGIAPPGPSGPVPVRLSVRCPRCGSARTEETSRFAATACMALWRCLDCREPFEHVKPV
jgi:ring-1,2-phenylacetyl-CoA epoxidase subunit PaaD